MTNTLWKTFFGQGDIQEDLQSPSRLSEDACGELVQSLVRLGYLTDIRTSLDGKSFFTNEQFEKDIMLQLENRAGRVALIDLPRAINASSSDIEEKVSGLIRSNPGKLVQVHDELFEIEYLDRLAEQLNSDLDQRGHFTLAEQSKKHRLSLDFMRQYLRDRIGTAINGQWGATDRGFVYADWFLKKEKELLRAELSGVEEPTSLSSLRSRRIVHDQLFHGICEALAKDQSLPGTFKGSGDQGTFVPRPYEKEQSEWIETFFRNNGFIDYDAIRKRGVADAKSYLQSNHPTALLLETHAVKESIWAIVDASVEDAISNLCWIDVKPLLPTPLTKDDVTSFLRQLPCLQHASLNVAIAQDQDHSLTGFGGGPAQETFVVQDSWVVTSGQVQKCLLEMGPLLDRKARALISWRLSYGDTAALEGQDDLELIDMPASKSSTLQDILASSRTSRKEKSRLKKDTGKKQLQDFLTVQDVREEIQQLEPDFDSAVVNAIAGIIYKDLLTNLRGRNKSIVLNQAEESQHQDADDLHLEESSQFGHEAIGLAMKELFLRLTLYTKGVEQFEDSSAKNSLCKYLLQSLCLEYADLATIYFANVEPDQHISNEAAQQAKEDAYHSFKLHEQSRQYGNAGSQFSLALESIPLLVEYVQQEVSEDLKKMRKIVGGSGKYKNLQEYMTYATSLEKKVTPLTTVSADKEREIASQHVNGLMQALSGTSLDSDAALMLHIVTLIAFQAWTGAMLHASGKYVPRILRQIRSTLETNGTDLAKGQLELLESMLGGVLSNTKCQDIVTLSNGSEQTFSHLWEQIQEFARQLSRHI